MKRPRPGAFCCYCKRPLTPAMPECGTSFSWDHVKCAKDGGIKRVPCCRKCNNLKDDLGVNDWFWFIGAHPRYWKEFQVPSQVRRVVLDYRRELAILRAAQA